MSSLIVGLICAVVGGGLAWLLTTLPTFRQSREYKRQLRQTIVGVPAAPGVEERPSLVRRVVGLETSIKDVGETVEQGVAAASQAAEQAITAASALPRLEASVGELKESHAELSATLRDHMVSEEAAITEMRTATKQRQDEVKASIETVREQAVTQRDEIQESVETIRQALTEHAAEDLAVATSIRTVAEQANEHAAAARKAAEEGAEASRVAATIDQQVQATTEAHSATLAAISTAVGAETPETLPVVEPSMGKRRRSDT